MLWNVTEVKVSLPEDEVEIFVERGGGKLSCPKRGKTYPGYDKPDERVVVGDVAHYCRLTGASFASSQI